MEKAQGSCLIVKPRQERGKGIAGAIVNGLRRQGVLVLEVDGEPGPGLQADYERLRAGGELKNVRQIIHLQSITGEKEADSPEELEKQLETGVYSLFYLVRALQDGVGHRETIDIVLISDYVHEATGRERCIHPGNAALFGLGKVVNVEYFNFRCRSIDIDGDTGVDDIMTEIAAGYSDYKVAYRGGKRYVEELESVDILKTAPRTRQGAGVTIKPEGVYIITGGTGGLGLEIAGWLALQGSRHIALINRSKIPDRSQWPGIIESGRTPALAEKIKCIQQIEKKGAALVCCPADVSNPGELEKTLGFLREKFGKINGIVHSAAVGSGQAGKRLSDDDPEIFRLVMAPKARGTWLLDRFTREDHLDFFVVFSGAITLVGGIGSGSYTAGNTYLNSFAQYRKKTGRHTAAMGWAVWEGSLKKYDIGFDSRKHLFEVQSTAEILQAFAEILESNVPLVIFGRLNHKSEIFHLGKRLPLRLSAGLPFPGLTAPPVKSPGAGAAPVELTGRPRGNYPEVEQQMAQVFGEFLGYREINVYDNFYELGGDSIIAAKMIQAVNHRHQLSLAVEDLLRCPTVAELGDILKGKNSGAAREKTLQQTLPAEALTAGRGYLTIQPVEKKEYYPAAEFQKTAHILSQLKGSKVVGLTYNLPVVMVVEGDIDKKRFSHIFQVLAQRHEALRTSFTEVDKQTVQRIHDKVFIPVDFIEVENDRGIDALVTDFIKPFDLGQAPLFRVQLAKLPAKNSPRRHLLLMDIHHGVSDGQSGMNLLKDFTDLYGNKELPELPVQFKDFINCRHQACNRPVLEKQEAYWLEVFKGGVPALNMPLDRPRPWMQSFKGDNVYTEAGEELSLRLNQVASRAGLTSFIVLLAAFQVLLSRYTGNEDMVIGVPVANRRHPQLQPLVGSFVNMLPLRNAPGKSKTFKELLNQVKANVIEAFENQDYFFGELIRRLGIQKELGRNPFYDVMLAMQIHEKPVMETKGLTFTPYPVLKNSADIDLTLDVKEKDKQLVFRWEYCSRLYNRETIEGLAANYTAVLEHITRDLNIFITDIAVEPRDFYRTGETGGKKV
jgi:NAD(P)-dependent dehydrogenase (short-subunit alcohol dehydrogenase family)/acyl carrier protein